MPFKSIVQTRNNMMNYLLNITFPWFVFLVNSSYGSFLNELQHGKKWINKRILKICYHEFPFLSHVNNPNVQRSNYYNVNTLRIRIDVSTVIIIHVWHQRTKPHGNNDKMLTLSGRCLPPSRVESCAGESDAVSHLKSLEFLISAAFVVPKQKWVR